MHSAPEGRLKIAVLLKYLQSRVCVEIMIEYQTFA